jgi:hypothetical protein
MYSLALIIFVVSEKKAFEHFPIGANVGKNVSKRFFSETTRTVETKLPMNDHWKVLYKVSVFMPIETPRWPPPQDRWWPSWSFDRHKKQKFVEDLPMIISGQFGFNYPSGFREAL